MCTVRLPCGAVECRRTDVDRGRCLGGHYIHYSEAALLISRPSARYTAGALMRRRYSSSYSGVTAHYLDWGGGCRAWGCFVLGEFVSWGLSVQHYLDCWRSTPTAPRAAVARCSGPPRSPALCCTYAGTLLAVWVMWREPQTRQKYPRARQKFLFDAVASACDFQFAC